jgi:hypothetical protein
MRVSLAFGVFQVSALGVIELLKSGRSRVSILSLTTSHWYD